jgi:hypothetical protein
MRGGDEGIDDINDPDFFSDANMEAIAEEASYADWAQGPNEVLAPGQQLRPRPQGDLSTLHFEDGVETVDLGYIQKVNRRHV